MRVRLAPLASFCLLLAFAALGVTASAQTNPPAPPDVKGLFLLTDYPSVTVQPGTTSTINLRLQNYALPPDRLALSVTGVPDGWTATLLGGGQPVAAAMAATNQNVSLQLRLDVPANAKIETHTLTITATGQGTTVSLPIAVSLAQHLPAKLSVKAELPALRGTAKSSFEYTINIKNDAGRNLVVSLAALAPKGFETTFTEQFGNQEISSLPIEAGQSKGVKLKVRPPSTIGANTYPVAVKVTAEDATAETKVALEITGQPQLAIAGREGLVSGRAEAGKETTIPLVVTNIGSAPAQDIELTASAPSGWKVTFEPKNIPSIAPGQNKEVQVRIMPPEKAIAGDYVTTLRASTASENATADFRIAVTTSTIWGIAGAGIIAVALLIMVGAVARFGRR